MRQLLLGILLCVSAFAKGQTFDEWFRQKKTQIKYYVQQIAALQVYHEVLQKGYNVAKDGLQVIDDLKHGDFNLHHTYFNSLSSINPSIARSATVQEIITLYAQVDEQTKATTAFIRNSSLLSNYRDYLFQIIYSFSNDVNSNRRVFLSLTSNNNFQLTDAERIKQLNAHHTRLERQYSFIKLFHSEIQLMAIQATKESNDTRGLQLLHDLK